MTLLHTVKAPMIMRNRRSIPLGTAVHAGCFWDYRYHETLKHYPIITPEVDGGYWYVYGTMYDLDYLPHGWGNMDYLYSYARQNQKHLTSYPLRWWFPNPAIQPDDIEDWIAEAMGRRVIDGEVVWVYPRIKDWTVVNEGWSGGEPTIPLIQESYEIARKLRPDSRLWYNGILTDEREQEQAKQLVLNGLADGIGLQFHHNLNTDHTVYIPLLQWLKDNHVPWKITELDVEIPDTSEWCLSQQALIYQDAVFLWQQYGGESISVWGVWDGGSWHAEYYPLPFDNYYQPKPAWNKLVQDR